MYRDSEVSFTTDMTIRFVKVTDDYSQAILGTWEGRSTGEEGSEFDDGENHRWEYKADGTYIYYRKIDGQWREIGDAYANYFVDGPLLCTRWKNDVDGAAENREWWEITNLENGVMNWKALRQREDGSTYIATFQMEKID